MGRPGSAGAAGPSAIGPRTPFGGGDSFGGGAPPSGGGGASGGGAPTPRGRADAAAGQPPDAERAGARPDAGGLGHVGSDQAQPGSGCRGGCRGRAADGPAQTAPARALNPAKDQEGSRCEGPCRRAMMLACKAAWVCSSRRLSRDESEGGRVHRPRTVRGVGAQARWGSAPLAALSPIQRADVIGVRRIRR